MKYTLFLLALLAVVACDTHAPADTATTTATDAPVTPETPVAEQPAPLPQKATYQRLLVGTWRATDDPNVRLTFTDTERQEAYADAEPTTHRYQLDYNCDGTAPVPATGDEPAYIRLEGDDMCWYIIAIDERVLELSYVGKGNRLAYERVE